MTRTLGIVLLVVSLLLIAAVLLGFVWPVWYTLGTATKVGEAKPCPKCNKPGCDKVTENNCSNFYSTKSGKLQNYKYKCTWSIPTSDGLGHCTGKSGPNDECADSGLIKQTFRAAQRDCEAKAECEWVLGKGGCSRSPKECDCSRCESC